MARPKKGTDAGNPASAPPAQFDPQKFRFKVEKAVGLESRRATKNSEVNGEINGIYNSAEAELGVNKSAMRLLVRLSRMDLAKRNDYLRTLEQGLEALDFDTSDMLDEPDDDELETVPPKPKPKRGKGAAAGLKTPPPMDPAGAVAAREADAEAVH